MKFIPKVKTVKCNPEIGTGLIQNRLSSPGEYQSGKLHHEGSQKVPAGGKQGPYQQQCKGIVEQKAAGLGHQESGFGIGRAQGPYPPGILEQVNTGQTGDRKQEGQSSEGRIQFRSDCALVR